MPSAIVFIAEPEQCNALLHSIMTTVKQRQRKQDDNNPRMTTVKRSLGGKYHIRTGVEGSTSLEIKGMKQPGIIST
jgi:hypothetical protein